MKTDVEIHLEYIREKVDTIQTGLNEHISQSIIVRDNVRDNTNFIRSLKYHMGVIYCSVVALFTKKWWG